MKITKQNLPLPGLHSVRYLTCSSKLLSLRLVTFRPTTWIRSQLLLLFPELAKLLHRLLVAEDIPELELVVDVGEAVATRPENVLADD